MSWKTHGATPRDNTQKVANATVRKKSNMPSKFEPLIHVCLYKGCCWVGTLGTTQHKASLPPPPRRRRGTARHKTGRHTEIPTPPLCLLHVHVIFKLDKFRIRNCLAHQNCARLRFGAVGSPRITDPVGSKTPRLPPQKRIRGSRITYPINPPFPTPWQNDPLFPGPSMQTRDDPAVSNNNT